MTIFAARQQRASKFMVADSLEPMVALLRSLVEEPERTAASYRKVWEGQRGQGSSYYNAVRDRYNAHHDPVDLLYLICRCVKNAVRFNGRGCFTQSVDKRRLGMHPDRMEAAALGISAILRGQVEFRTGDWQETSADAGPQDFVYMDPPYLGTSVGRDKRYHQQLTRERLIAGLVELRRRGVPFALSYDGMTGGREYGPPLPGELGLTRLLLDGGTSSQATLSGRREQTIESLYVTPGLAESVGGVIGLKAEQLDHGPRSLGRDLVAKGTDSGVDFLIWHYVNVPQLAGLVESRGWWGTVTRLLGLPHASFDRRLIAFASR